MEQKVLKVGTSAAVTISKDMLMKIGVKIGDRIDVEHKDGAMIVRKKDRHLSKEDQKIAKLTANFIDRYRGDFEALSKK